MSLFSEATGADIVHKTLWCSDMPLPRVSYGAPFVKILFMQKCVYFFVYKNNSLFTK